MLGCFDYRTSMVDVQSIMEEQQLRHRPRPSAEVFSRPGHTVGLETATDRLSYAHTA